MKCSVPVKQMKIDSSKFRASPNAKVNLGKCPTDVKPLYKSKEDYEAGLEQHREKLAAQQDMLYAYDRYALLLIFQAMDAAGKDSAIKHVMSGVNPQGCQVYNFKKPSDQELSHDFLWRTTVSLPQRGRIGIFNRSYYEEVLIVRVHPEVLQNEKLPPELLEHKNLWQQRYESIADLEKHLYRNGTRIIKFFLHVSREEQRQRFLARIDDATKNWKFSVDDIHERKYWDQYMQAYEKCISATSENHAPWYIVPADNKKNARLIISQIILDAFAELKMSYPKTGKAREKELQAIRKELA